MMNIASQSQEILLVEDNDDDAEMVSTILAENHITHTMCRVRNAEDALARLLPCRNYSEGYKYSVPRAILLDLNLPKLNGIELLRRLRSHQRTEHVPVFVFTSAGSDYNAFECYRLGITGYINKKTSYEKLESSLLETEMFLTTFKVLLAEDDKNDAAILMDQLDHSSLNCTYHCVYTKEAYKKALAEFEPDIIFSDYDLPPKFDAIQAVRILKKTALQIPFILVTGALSEDRACGCLAEGMDDYLLKGKIERLPAVMINCLRRKKAEMARLVSVENRFQAKKEQKPLFDALSALLSWHKPFLD